MKHPTDEERNRLSGIAMRTFANITERWKLSEQRKSQLLGCQQQELHEWTGVARSQETLVLDVDPLVRISAVLGVFAGLRLIMRTPDEESRWLSCPIELAPFDGKAPIDLMSASYENQIEVRQCLAGIARIVVAGVTSNHITSYTIEEIVWN